MAIRMYEEWLKESEQVDPVTPPTETPATPAQSQEVDVPLEVGTESPTTEEPAPTEQEEFDRIDQERRDAITAFKEKQKEFMQIPEETRNNPVSEEDKTRVESLKAELKNLNETMKAAVAAYDEFNDKMLGSSTGEEVEP